MNEAVEVEAVVIEEPSAELAVTYTPATIEDNLAALDAYVDQQLEPYQGAIIDPENEQQVKDGRKAMADLNDMKAPIEAERKRIKREYEAPLKAFEARVKDITSKIDAARAEIKKQVDDADAQFKADRTALLEDEYEGIAGPLANMIPLDALMKPEWLRRSTTFLKAAKQLGNAASDAFEGYKTLQGKQLQHRDAVLAKYCETVDLMAALKVEDELNAEDQRMAEFKAVQEAVMPEPEPEPASEETTTAEPQIVAEPQFYYSLTTEFIGTKEKAQHVGQALNSFGIKGTIKCKGRVSYE